MPTADVAKQGLDLYNAGDFAGAIPHLTRAHEMEPNNFEIHYTLAQALRQSGKCGDAVPHYKQLVETAPDTVTATNVRSTMELCTANEPPPPPPPPAPAPVIIHDGGVRRSDVILIGGAGAGLAAAVCLALAARSDAHDADDAASYHDHERIDARSTRLYIGSGIAAAVGLTLGVIAIVELRSSKEQSTSISVAPSAGGGTLVLGGSW